MMKSFFQKHIVHDIRYLRLYSNTWLYLSECRHVSTWPAIKTLVSCELITLHHYHLSLTTDSLRVELSERYSVPLLSLCFNVTATINVNSLIQIFHKD